VDWQAICCLAPRCLSLHWGNPPSSCMCCPQLPFVSNKWLCQYSRMVCCVCDCMCTIIIQQRIHYWDILMDRPWGTHKSTGDGPKCDVCWALRGSGYDGVVTRQSYDSIGMCWMWNVARTHLQACTLTKFNLSWGCV